MSPANLIGSIIFGGIGLAAFIYGKKTSSLKSMMIGGALMVYPYVIPGTAALYAIGILLTACLFFFRD